MVKAFVPNRRLILARNPGFREWSRDAQPDGYPDAIDWSLSGGPTRAGQNAAVDTVQRGEADLYNDQPPNERIDELTTRYASQAHLWPFTGSFSMFLNTRVPPFDDPRVRRALAYAVDRRAVRERYPGPAVISCQLLPPNFTGYQPYCPYTLDPGLAGTWTAPDRARAERLIKESGTSGTKVTVWSHADFAGVSRYFARLLDSLGYQARVRVLGGTGQPGFDKFYYYLADSRHKAQMGAYWEAGSGSVADLTAGFRCRSFTPNDAGNGTSPSSAARRWSAGSSAPWDCRPPTRPRPARPGRRSTGSSWTRRRPSGCSSPRESTWSPNGSATTSATRCWASS